MAGTEFRMQRMASYIAGHQQSAGKAANVAEYVRSAYQSWVNYEILTYERQHLTDKYPSYKYLVQEYYEGMLLFEVSNLKVWGRSADSTLLADFYQRNGNRYTWKHRVHYATCTVADATKLPKLKKLMGTRALRLSARELSDEASRKLKTPCTCTRAAALPDAPEVALALQDAKGLSEHRADDGAGIATRILRTTQNEPKSLSECRGELTADLQQELERQWLDELRQHHSVEVNQQALNALKAELQ